jgi:hypothetical protein
MDFTHLVVSRAPTFIVDHYKEFRRNNTSGLTDEDRKLALSFDGWDGVRMSNWKWNNSPNDGLYHLTHSGYDFTDRRPEARFGLGGIGMISPRPYLHPPFALDNDPVKMSRCENDHEITPCSSGAECWPIRRNRPDGWQHSCEEKIVSNSYTTDRTAKGWMASTTKTGHTSTGPYYGPIDDWDDLSPTNSIYTEPIEKFDTDSRSYGASGWCTAHVSRRRRAARPAAAPTSA